MGFTLHHCLQLDVLNPNSSKKAPAYGGGFLMVIKAALAIQFRVLE
jgi:hypothetical protein